MYGASKAALGVLEETLRLELAPFDVKVMTIITGAVETNIMSNNPEIRLLPDSLYQKAEEYIAKRARGEDVSEKMNASVYANSVVKDILSGATGKVWRGGMASVVRVSTSVLPTSILVSSPVFRIELEVADRYLGSHYGQRDRVGSTPLIVVDIKTSYQVLKQGTSICFNNCCFFFLVGLTPVVETISLMFMIR